MRNYSSGSQQQQELMNEGGRNKIGPFVFTTVIPLHLARHLKHMYRNYKNRIDTLRIENGRLDQLISPQALEIAQSFQMENLQKIFLTNNKICSLTFLQKCHFPYLLVINLSRNRLSNLTDVWNNLHFPNLQEIYLHNNQITSIKGIKRWNFPQLNKLTLDFNFIVSLQELPHANLPALKQLLIYSNQIADFRSIFKSSFYKLQNFSPHENIISDSLITFTVLSTKFQFLEVGSLEN